MTANPFSNIPPIGPTSGSAPAQASSRFKPVDPLRLFRQHMVLLIVTAIVGIGLGIGAWYVLLQTSDEYTSRAQLKASAAPGNPFAIGTAGGSGSDIERFMANEAQKIQSHEILRKAVDTPEIRNTNWFKSYRTPTGNPDFSQAVESLQQDHFRVSPQRDSTLISLAVTMPNQNDAPIVLEQIINTYLRDLQIETSQASGELRSVFIEERDDAEQEVNRLQTQIERFIDEGDLPSMNVERSDAGIKYQNLSQQEIQLGLQLEAARANYQNLLQSEEQGDLTASPQEQAELERIARIQRLDETILSLRQSRRTMTDKYGEQHRAVTSIGNRIAAAQAERKIEMDKELRKLQQFKLQQANQAVETVKSQLAALQPKIQGASARMTDIQNKLQRYNELNARKETAQERRNRAANSLNELRMAGGRPDAVRIQRQISPTDANLTFPKLTIIVPGITVLVLGSVTGLLFLRELLDQRVKSPQDVKLVSDANLLGVVPNASEDPSGARDVERVVEASPTGLLAESFRQVRTALLSKMDRRGYKSLVLVSAQPGAGASAITHNIAASLAYNGRRVLVIDANFRRPAQHQLSGIDNDRGLVDILRDGANPSDLIHRGGELDLAVLPTGDAHQAPPELLDGDAFRNMLSQLEASYDTILIDAPPALLTSDAQLLAKHVDAMAIVVRAARDKRGMVERMIRQLDGQRADILGVVLNGVRSAAGGYFRKSYQEFYRYQTNGNGSASKNGNGRAAASTPRRGRSRRGAEANAETDSEQSIHHS